MDAFFEIIVFLFLSKKKNRDLFGTSGLHVSGFTSNVKFWNNLSGFVLKNFEPQKYEITNLQRKPGFQIYRLYGFKNNFGN